MVKDRSDEYMNPVKRLLMGIVVFCLLAIFLFWQIDNLRVERFRAQVTDEIVTRFVWLMSPITASFELIRDFQSYQRLVEQNEELRSELQQMRTWKEAALQLEQENARLLDLNKVRLDPRLTYITGLVIADSGSAFRQSVLLNVGSNDGILDGWAVMDGIGLVGRVSGVGETSSRVILLTDATSSIPAIIQPSGQTTLINGDNSLAPQLKFVEDTSLVRPGDRVVTSSDGGIFPPNLLIGQVATDTAGGLRVRLAADFERLKFLRLLRYQSARTVEDTGALIIPNSIARADENTVRP
ncbi:MAG: rod shape-determining protein MreC [Aestuariivita sp.]|nr:rod shape-determining protein MreC [Aestuariivita sp.]MCY4201488.1 rod shape-determining protein MreC [Aestuariivita sp.]MCY4287731.1 rod shape-determining protein MreC [Aestuariivita sp.]MCY4347021.1 rod shape-determining protein MreC [Aestuariivita sp.]